MALHQRWVHGNALVVESPEVLVDGQPSHFGWGADLLVQGGGESWFHLPLPTPTII